ncbi:MAG: DUF1403 family protein [Rhodobacteraceae bacterium]|nr:DUF1403 family protein [Paracoccaceae bacterium]
MTHALPHDPDTASHAHRLPDWLGRGARETPEDAGFSAGAALALLDAARANPSLPQALWRARLGLIAGAQSAALIGRPERDAALRDILCLLRPGEKAGPAGELALAWARATARPLSDASLQRALPDLRAPLAYWHQTRQGNPVAQAAHVIEAVLADGPRNTLTALILADAALARAMGWSHLVPLLGASVTRRDLTQRGDDLRMACHKAVIGFANDALALAADLIRRAAQLQSVAPKLRSKQAATAVGMFLTRDAIAPAALTPLMSDRTARRFCDRLVSLGVARELTGRDTFRLYGL